MNNSIEDCKTVNNDPYFFDPLLLIMLLFITAFSRVWIIQFPQHVSRGEAVYKSTWDKMHSNTFFIPEEKPLFDVVLYYLSDIVEIKNPYPSNLNQTYPNWQYVSLREIGALISIISVPLVYLTLRSFQFTKYVSFCGALIALFDTSSISTGRYINSKGLSQFLIALCLYFHVFTDNYLAHILSSSLLYGSHISGLIFVFYDLKSSYKLFGKKIFVISIGIVISIQFLVGLLFTSVVSNDDKLKEYKTIRSIKNSLVYAFTSDYHIIKPLFKTFSFNNFIKRLIMLGETTVMCSDDNRTSYCVINYIIIYLAIALSVYELFHTNIQLTYDYARIFIAFFIYYLISDNRFPNVESFTLTIPATVFDILWFKKRLGNERSVSFITLLTICTILYFFWVFRDVYGYEK